MAKHYGMLISLDSCIGCWACTVACKAANGLDIGVNWNRVESIGDPKAKPGQDMPAGTYPDVSLYWLPMPCMHCQKAPCMNACPASAISRREDGIVMIDQNRCLGCGYCAWMCPYGVPQFNRTTNTMGKCTFCASRVDQGQQPACVEACVYGARVFGDLNDPNSEISRLIAQKKGKVLLPEHGTEPSVFYAGR